MKDNVKVKIDLSKFYRAQLMTAQDGTRGVFLPLDANRIYIGEKGWYLNLVAFEHQNEWQSHFMKLDLPRDITEGMSQEQRNGIPVVGSIRPMGMGNKAAAQAQGPAPAWATAPAGGPLMRQEPPAPNFREQSQGQVQYPAAQAAAPVQTYMMEDPMPGYEDLPI